MNKSTTIAIDLAKSSFQVCKLVGNHVATEKPFSKAKLKSWLLKQPPCTVVMESCATSHFWGRFCQSIGHEVILIAPKNVSPFRTNQKTDKNDAMAIAVAAKQPNVHFIAVKSVRAQSLQSVDKMRQHLVDTITATSNMIRALIAEFGIDIPRGTSAFGKQIPLVLEDAENGLPDIVREQISTMYWLYQDLIEKKEKITKQLNNEIQQQPECRALTAIEGVGNVNALALYLAIGENGGNFKNGREASACIGLTPKQYSTGGKTVLLGIGKKFACKRIRANLIQGALAFVRAVDRREPKTTKEAWVKGLIERAGLRRAAVALANKTVRTAWSMLNHHQPYRLPETV
ncbi:IS110 family transposase [Vibrio hangzhouensis]|uniref:Transposase n=2 Tax=Vibrio hangzhouensis TaxID=462991 RepID=A0A1H6BZ09_9VIBR|nr:IS110 family transposase [Vibrio hangzhouensis]SEG65902.1 Transposase [Vibrio hangzhouensis]